MVARKVPTAPSTCKRVTYVQVSFVPTTPALQVRHLRAREGKCLPEAPERLPRHGLWSCASPCDYSPGVAPSLSLWEDPGCA